MIPTTSPINDTQCISSHCTGDCMLCAFQNEFTTDLSAAIAELGAVFIAGITGPWPVFVALEARGIIAEE